MKLCVFCDTCVDDDVMVCPKCKEYKGLVEAKECRLCHTPLPAGNDFKEQRQEHHKYCDNVGN